MHAISILSKLYFCVYLLTHLATGWMCHVAAILNFILLQKSSSPLLSNLVPLKSCKCFRAEPDYDGNYFASILDPTLTVLRWPKITSSCHAMEVIFTNLLNRQYTPNNKDGLVLLKPRLFEIVLEHNIEKHFHIFRNNLNKFTNWMTDVDL